MVCRIEKNTSKNYLIYHPHWTPQRGWKWIETYTPHVTFSEDEIFGDHLNSFDKQKTISYWSSSNLTSLNRVPSLSNIVPQENQTSYKFEGEQLSNQSSDEHHKSLNEDIQIPVPNVPSIPKENWPQKHEDLTDSLVRPSSPVLAEISNKETLSENVQQNNQQDDQISESSDNLHTLDNNSDQGEFESVKKSNSQNEMKYDHIMTGWNEVAPIAGQKRQHSPNKDTSHLRDRVVGLEGPKYDQVMTGWDEVPHQAGKKRQHSPETSMTISKRGRPVKKVDYKSLHRGKVAKTTSDPKSWKEAMSSQEVKYWRETAEEELRSLKSTGTVEIIQRSRLPKGRLPMKCKWVFKKKFLADGSLEKYRARCTVKGFTQRRGIDYHETFAPTPRPETGRIVLVLAHIFNWHRRQGDVPVAFLNPDLDVDLYMEMPEGFKIENHIMLIKKGLYGLKQAAALWYDDVRAFLAEQKLFPTTVDVCLYTNKQKTLFVLIHVDDFQVIGPNLNEIDKLMQSLYRKYKLKSVETDLFLGIQISNPDKRTLKLSQGHYARKLLDRRGLATCKTVARPLERLLEPNSSHCSKQEFVEYNSIIGGLQYLANNTRPDITHSVNHLARFLANPSNEHLQAARRVLRYIAKDPDRGIVFKSNSTRPILAAYTDADFSGDPSTSRSTSGSLITLASGPISWRSRLQREVVLSTTEAEYLAATETCRELQWVKSLFLELSLSNRIEGADKTNLYVDNQSAISLITNHDNHKRSKHIALRNYYCRQKYQRGEISVVYIQSNKQLADSLTEINSAVAIQ